MVASYVSHCLVMLESNAMFGIDSALTKLLET